MPKRNDDVDTRKAGAKLSKSKKKALARRSVSRKDYDFHHKAVAAKKYGFKGAYIDTTRDWLEVEVEFEEDDTQNVNGIECQFLTNKYQQMN